ncbi:D-alanyl-D-alanine carboxypeptidase [Methyloligella halotolerans]|uniref:D-alanyl-D-alanine carboxypeptidase n=1 Tax=Methyloligella halotolerans TaxID=1177755 RepID=UPI0014718607|nr:D-alanyl-D-alanine carboxypeptidase [Methyloligella halotolerans]
MSLLTLAMLLPPLRPAQAASDFRSAIVVDMNNGEVLFARSADTKRYPASLTKIMTLYVLFGYLRDGRITLDSELTITPHAASQPPTKLGLKPGSTIRTEDAIKSLVTKSANDMAAAVAENLAGTESNFARIMTQQARAIGMKNTVFKNASGLPNNAQVTTARDMAILGERIMRDYPEYYHYFSLTSFSYKGRSYRNHNHLLGNYSGTDGIKTGFIRASGFNLTASCRRDGKHLLTVVLGGSTSGGRDATVRYLFDKHWAKASVGSTREPFVASPGMPLRRPPVFAVASAGGRSASPAPQPVSYQPQPQRVAVRNPLAEVQQQPQVQARPQPQPQLVGRSENGAYHVQVGSYTTPQDADRRLTTIQSQAGNLLSGHQPVTTSFQNGSTRWYRARFANFSQSEAEKTCSSLKRMSVDCIAMRAE